jgi:hypothetical protein
MSEKSSKKVIDINAKSGNFFDNLDALRIDQNFAEQIGVEKVITRIPIRKPGRQEWVRVHTDENFHIQLALFEYEQEGDYYVLDHSLLGLLTEEVAFKKLYYSINRQGVVFLWPAKLPDATGRIDDWNKSRHKAANLAMGGWVRVASNRSLGAYEVYTPQAKLDDPVWPELSLNEILEIAFEDKIICEKDHPILKSFWGYE